VQKIQGPRGYLLVGMGDAHRQNLAGKLQHRRIPQCYPQRLARRRRHEGSGRTMTSPSDADRGGPEPRVDAKAREHTRKRLEWVARTTLKQSLRDAPRRRGQGRLPARARDDLPD